MKNLNLFLSAAALALVAASCGGNKNNNQQTAQTQCGWVNGAYIQCQPGQQPNSPNPWPSNGVPGGPQVQCPSGQFKLRNQCVYASSFPMACQMIQGQIYQASGHTVCMTERPLSGFSVASMNHCAQDTSMMGGATPWMAPRVSLNSGTYVRGSSFRTSVNFLGEGCMTFNLMNVRVSQYEYLKLQGSVRPRNTHNGWSLTLKRGYSLLGSAQSGSVMNENGDNFQILAPIGATASYAVNGQYPYGTPNPQQTSYPQGVYQPGMNPTMLPQYYSEPFQLEAQISGRNRIEVRLSAMGCEDGYGNYYPCF